jgi:hypothetical protein
MAPPFAIAKGGVFCAPSASPADPRHAHPSVFDRL